MANFSGTKQYLISGQQCRYQQPHLIVKKSEQNFNHETSQNDWITPQFFELFHLAAKRCEAGEGQTAAVEKYLRSAAERQSGKLMPQNLKSSECPALIWDDEIIFDKATSKWETNLAQYHREEV